MQKYIGANIYTYIDMRTSYLYTQMYFFTREPRRNGIPLASPPIPRPWLFQRIAQVDLESTILPYLPPECGDDRHMPSFRVTSGFPIKVPNTKKPITS